MDGLSSCFNISSPLLCGWSCYLEDLYSVITSEDSTFLPTLFLTNLHTVIICYFTLPGKSERDKGNDKYNNYDWYYFHIIFYYSLYTSPLCRRHNAYISSSPLWLGVGSWVDLAVIVWTFGFDTSACRSGGINRLSLNRPALPIHIGRVHLNDSIWKNLITGHLVDWDTRALPVVAITFLFRCRGNLRGWKLAYTRRGSAMRIDYLHALCIGWGREAIVHPATRRRIYHHFLRRSWYQINIIINEVPCA